MSFGSGDEHNGLWGSIASLLIIAVVGIVSCAESCRESEALSWAERRFNVAAPEAVTDSEGRIFVLLETAEGTVDSVHITCEPECKIVKGYPGADLYQIALAQDDNRAVQRAIVVEAAAEAAGSE